MRYLLLILMASHVLQAQNIAGIRNFKNGKVVTANGHVTATFGTLSFIQDHSAGIAIYGADVKENDSVSVTGKLSKFNGLLEVVADSVKIFGQRPPISAKVISDVLILGEHEAELVRINSVHFSNHNIFFYPEHNGLILKNSDTTQYWIDENTDLPGYNIPETSNITGVVSRYGNQIQLMPRAHTDIENSTPAQKSVSGNFKIMNWNLEFFGAPKYGPTNDQLQLTNVARVLNGTHPDIIAVQEVSSDVAFKDLLQLIPGYGGRCSSRYSFSFDQSGDYPPQKLCFIYNKETVNVIREKILFRKYFDDNPSDIFSSGRLPYLLEVEVMGRRIQLINIHAKSGDEKTDYSRRLLDARLLKDSLDRYHGDLILLGDLNDDLDESIITGNESPYKDLVDDAKYDCISKDLNSYGWHSTISYDDMIDHQIISSSLRENFVKIDVVDAFSFAPLYQKTTSDHLPVMSEFDMTKSITEVQEPNNTPGFYPNPTSGLIFVPEGSDVTIVDQTGIAIYETKNAHSPISIDKCAPGIYIMILDGRPSKIVKY